MPLRARSHERVATLWEPTVNHILILRHVPHETAGTLENALAGAGLDFQYVNLYEKAPDRLPLARAAGLVVLGGPMNVDEVDRYPFLAQDVCWIREAVERQLPVLGICLGSQLLAKAMGARVYPNQVKEIGWYPIELTPQAAEDRLFAETGTRTVFQWHGDTFDLPAGAVRLAHSPLCSNQAFRCGPRAYGLQFHIEMTTEMIDDWLNEAGNCGELAQLHYIDPQAIRRQIPQQLPGLQALAQRVLGRFAAMCRV